MFLQIQNSKMLKESLNKSRSQVRFLLHLIIQLIFTEPENMQKELKNNTMYDVLVFQEFCHKSQRWTDQQKEPLLPLD